MYRALIVEDERLMREYLAARLNAIHPAWEAAATAADGIEAIEALSRERFDAVITDIRMPGMDGLELARYMRSECRDTDVVILSGYDEFAYAQSAMRLNVFDYLLKPLNDEELAATLSGLAVRALRRRQSEGDPAKRLLNALWGDAQAWNELREAAAAQGDAAFGLMALAPAITTAQSPLENPAQRLTEEVRACFGGNCAALDTGETLLLLTARDPALIGTLCEKKRLFLAKAHADRPICAAYVPLEASGTQTRQRLQTLRDSLLAALATACPISVGETMREQRVLLAQLRSLMDELARAHERGQAEIADDLRQSADALLSSLTGEAAYATSVLLLGACGEHVSHEAIRTAMAQAGREGGARSETLCRAYAMLVKQLDSEKAQRAGVEASDGVSLSALSQRARDYLNAHYREPISLSAVADALHVSSAYLSDVFHRETGESYSRCLLRLRMQDAAARLLENPGLKVYEISEAVGFPSAKHFTHVFRSYYQLSPKEYREQQGISGKEGCDYQPQ